VKLFPYMLAAASPAWLSAVYAVAVPVVVGFICWLALGVLNAAVWFADHQDWDAWAKGNPKKAAAVRVSRALGPHFRKLVAVARTYLAERARAGGIAAPVIDLETRRPKSDPPAGPTGGAA
jgi:hypothetical protein